MALPQDVPQADRIGLDALRAIERPFLFIVAIGHGECYMPHKVDVALHVAKLLEGIGSELLAWRRFFCRG